MSKVCFTDLRDALKSVVAKEDLEGLVKEIQDKAAFRMRQNMEPKAQALGKTIDDLIEEEKFLRDKRKMDAYRNILIHKELKPMVDSFAKRGQGLLAAVDGTARNLKDGRYSANALSKAMSNRLRAQFTKELTSNPEHKDLMAVFNSHQYEPELAREIYQRGSSKDPKIRAIADAWEKSTDRSVKMLNSVGAYISRDETKGYLGRMQHDSNLVARPFDSTPSGIASAIAERAKAMKEGKNVYEHMQGLAYTNWKNFILNHLNADETFKGADSEKFLRGAWEGIVSGVHKTPYAIGEEGQAFKVGRVGNMSDRLSKQRVFIWKDGDAELAYIHRYGSGSLHNTMMKTLDRAGQDYGLMRRFGPNPMAMFYRLRKEVVDSNRLEKGINRNVNLAENTLRAKAMGDKAETRVFANVASSARMIKSLHDMAGVFVYTIPDMAIRMSKMHELGVPYWQTTGQIIKDIFSGVSKKERKEIGDVIGVWSHTTQGSMHSKVSAVDTPRDKLGRAGQMLFKYTGLEYMDDVARSGTAAAISRILSHYRNDAYGGLHEGIKKNLTAYGIGEKEWEVVRKSAQMINGKKFITPDGMWTADKKLFEDYAGKELTDNEASKLRQEFDNRLSTFFMDQVDDAQIQNRESTRRLGVGNTQAGTVSGELARTVMMFKMWGIEATRRTFGRMIYGNDHSSFMDAMINGKTARYQMMSFMASIIGLSYIAEAAKSLISNQTPPSMYKWSTAKRVILGSGAFGYYGSLLSNDYSFNRQAAEILGGPLTGTINDVGKVINDLTNLNNPTKSTLALLDNNIPLINVWYAKQAMNFAFLNAWHEQNHPGYFWKKEKKMLEDTGQQYLINPLAFSH